MTAEQVLKQKFGYDEFRLHQKEVIESCLRGEDSLVIMPTGGGKSVCFQIPALLLEGVTIVVSPLIALMKDQVDSLKLNGIAAEFLNSSLSAGAQRDIIEQLRQGKIKLLYLAPERISEENSLSRLVGEVKVSLIAIDEAHCISHWGHDFRPDYLVLGSLKKQFPDVPVMALTASADKTTRDDIIKQLGLVGDNHFISSFNRPNIWYYVYKKEQFDRFLPVYLDKHKDQSGIIYCLSRKSTEELADELNQMGYSAACYHAGLERNLRQKVQEDFINDRIKLMVATIAFGMGIDKSDVRFVIHADLPKNIESYYQETGRAGRDGLPSDAILFYGRGDVAKLSYFIDNENTDAEHSALMYRKLKQMASFAEAHKCRRQMLMQYFNEDHPGQCNSCDYCLGNYVPFDGTIPAQMVLSAVARLGERFGIKMIIDFLRGSESQKITPEMRNIKTYGIGKDHTIDEWHDLIGQLINMKILELSGEQYPVLKLNGLSKEVLKGTLPVNLSKSAKAAKASIDQHQVEVVDENLLRQLKYQRKLIADSEGVPPYIVLSDLSLTELVMYLPETTKDLSEIAGFGEYKINRYGDNFLAMIKEYCQLNNMTTRMYLKDLGYGHGRKRKKPGTHKLPAMGIPHTTGRISLDMYRNGKTVSEIAKERELAMQTIYSHLISFIPSGEIALNEIVNEDKVVLINQAVEINGIASLKILKEYLGDDYEYHEIKAVIESKLIKA